MTSWGDFMLGFAIAYFSVAAVVIGLGMLVFRRAVPSTALMKERDE